MIKSIAFTAYSVSDMARARRFYEEVLGLTPAHSSGDFWQEYDLGEGTFGIGVIPDRAPEFFRRRNSAVAFEVEDLDAALAKVKQQDVPILYGPVEYPSCRMFVITDPDENLVTMHQRAQKA